ncbi:MAG TPA: GNAT family N-acetyltransferase [Polyangia bacterium]|nr:GNAT family N-acetyltransferase [Polyangia bacterium]
MPPVIRVAHGDDLPRVSELAAELVRQHHRLDRDRFMLIEPIADGYRWFFNQELTRKEAVILVAEVAGVIVGYSYGTLEPRNWNDLLDTCGKLNDVFVDPSARRLGVGRQLCSETIAALRKLGAPRVVLLAAWKNSDAHVFFESLGFRRTMLEMTAEIAIDASIARSRHRV